MVLTTKTAEISCGAVVALLMTAIGSWAGLQQDASMSIAAKSVLTDEPFVRDAAYGGMAEIKFAQLAKEKTSSDGVKEYASRMIADYTQSNNELKEVASKANISLPTELHTKDQAIYEKLSRRDGADFDRAYAEEMVSDHEEDLQAFDREASSGGIGSLRNYASQTIPMIHEHLNLAKEMSKNVSSIPGAGGQPQR